MRKSLIIGWAKICWASLSTDVVESSPNSQGSCPRELTASYTAFYKRRNVKRLTTIYADCHKFNVLTHVREGGGGGGGGGERSEQVEVLKTEKRAVGI